MKKPRWISREAFLLLHEASLAAYGGASGTRDEGLLDSALTRPVNRYLYEPGTDIPALAASYGFGIAKNHPFVDGNKRAAFGAVGLFLLLNGLELIATEAEAIVTILNLASSDLTESEFADWIRKNSVRRKL